MSTAGHTPNFIAEEDILPFRCVKVGSVPFKAVPSTSDPEVLLGVTDGSVQGFQSVYHAKVGQPISLQNGEFVQLTAGGTIAVGDTLIATTDGKVIADTASTEYIAQAVDNASNGEVFWAKKIGAWTVGGGGGGTMTINVQEFDNPEAANVWTKPAGAVSVMVQLCGAGQDGGTGGEGSAPYGGNGGTIAQKEFDATDLPSTVSVTLGLHQPWGTASEDGTSAFGTYVYAPMAAYTGPNGADAGGSNLQVCGSGSSGTFRFGMGANDDMGPTAGNQGAAFGPGGGGGSYNSPTSGVGGKASTADVTNYFGAMVVKTGGGGAAGTFGIGEPGGNGGNGSIDPVTGFGGGGGAGGGTDAVEDAGDGGNGIRGGGGGAAGQAGPGGNDGFPGQGGDGYVRVTTICFN